LRPNILVDITSVYRRKKRALKRYRSQLRLKDYLGHITALNTLRALTVNGPRYVEGFWSLERPMSEEEVADWLSYKKALTPGY
jgi:LmbE family N-acetylglucosaminyl deacetylase